MTTLGKRKFVIRADASTEIGTGHVMRCLTLADKLKKRDASVSFICRELPGNLCALIEKKHFKVHRLANYTTMTCDQNVRMYDHRLRVNWRQDVKETQAILSNKNEVKCDWLIVDHYSLDERWESSMRAYVGNIMVIDDQADRPHDCDLLFDQDDLLGDKETRYAELTPVSCNKIVGIQHALLRDEFLAAKQNVQPRDGFVKRILIFLGGADSSNETAKILRAVELMNRSDLLYDVIVGHSNPHQSEIQYLVAKIKNACFHKQVENMAEFMLQADLAVGGGGTTIWERCYLGLPSIVVVLAENQKEQTNQLARRGLLTSLQEANHLTADDYNNAIESMIKNPQRLRAQSGKCLELAIADETGRLIECLLE
jgi:UDP-2,4-diacetamido-2,4,6-trideoxy-beta-L-altropyranose hydrolase